MSIDELRVHLRHLIERYVTDAAAKASLLDLTARPEVPAKGILADLTPYLAGRVSAADQALIQQIAFYFC